LNAKRSTFWENSQAVHILHYKSGTVMGSKLENVAIIAMYCHLRPRDVIAFAT